jgi:hypothetical protein
MRRKFDEETMSDGNNALRFEGKKKRMTTRPVGLMIDFWPSTAAGAKNVSGQFCWAHFLHKVKT